MLPSEFINSFGRPRLRALEVPLGVDVILPPDPNRAVLMLLSTTGPVFYAPFDGGEVPTTLAQFNGGDIPLTFTHALHASIVNMSWVFTDGGGPVTVNIVEVLMSKNERFKRITRECKKINKV
jgi:hypothetical protein